MTYLTFGVVVKKEQNRNAGNNDGASYQNHNTPADLYYPNPDTHERFVAAIKDSMNQNQNKD